MSPPIPPEIISDILLRLPVKPLLRFRTVSKPWCALIDSPYFTKRHLQQSITAKSNRSLYLYSDGAFYYLDYSALQSAIRLQIPFEYVSGIGIVRSCTGSCNGLFLLLKKDYYCRRNDIYLFNPATRQYRVIPDTQFEYPIPSDQVSIPYAEFGFGYDSVNDDYKVLKFVQFNRRNNKWISSEARIYSLKEKTWHKIENFPYCLALTNKNFGVHLNGRLHSVVYTSDIFTYEANLREIMVAFDLSTEEFHYIPFPNGFDENHNFSIRVGVVEGMLCVQGTYGYGTDIWLMREYGVNESWFMFRVPKSAIYPIIMSSNGQEVLLSHNDKNLMWYDLERKHIRMSPFQGLPGPFKFGVKVCVDSLVSVNSIGQSQGEETEERQGRETEGNEAKEEGRGADSSIAGT